MHLRAYVSCVGACNDPVDSCSAYAIASASQLCTFACVRLYEWWPQPDSHDYVTRTCHDNTERNGIVFLPKRVC